MFPLDVTSFNQIFSGAWLWVFIAMSVCNGIFLLFASLKFLLVLQQGGYYYKRYFKWLSSPETPYLSRLMLLCLLGFLFFLVLNICFAPVFGNTICSFVGFIPYIIFTSLYIHSEQSVNAKVPLKRTKRLVRLSITYVIVLALATFGLLTLLNYIAFVIADEVVAILRFSLIAIMPILLPFLLFVAYCINEPLEEIIRRYYLKKTKDKLNNLDVIKIGITGSFGKTSVKEILKTILSQKYRVLATPESYNTPMGICLTVKNLSSTHDVFIAEMGARNVGDIKELARLVKPKYGVLTGINAQHLESFKTIENTKKTKFELMENLDKDGVGFFSSDNKDSVELFNKFGGEKYLAGINDGFVKAENIVTDKDGTHFTLKIQGEKPIECYTVLLGEHSITNILLAVSVAYKMGLSVEEIARGIDRIESVKHRLELVPNNKNVVIIDDSYNSNVDGINAAMGVLDLFSGRKIVVTPGLIELGKIENIANYEFGKILAKKADIVIVIGRHNAEMIISGLLEEGKTNENIVFKKSLKKGNEYLNTIIKEGDVIMFLNDLPDNYS